MDTKHIKFHGYARDGVPGMSLEDQEAMLLSALPSGAPIKADRLGKTQIRRRRYDDLGALREMLEETEPQTGIAVVDLAVLGWTAGDVCRSVSTILRSGSLVYITRDDHYIHPGTSCADFLPLLTSFLESDHGRPSAKGREAAVKASAEKRAKDRDDRLMQARPLWRDSSLTIAQVARQVGLSPRALHKHLGPRGSQAGRAHYRNP